MNALERAEAFGRFLDADWNIFMWIMAFLVLGCILYGVYYLYKDLQEACEKDMSRQERKLAGIILLLIIYGLPIIYFSGFLREDKMIAGDDYLLGRYPLEVFTQNPKDYEWPKTDTLNFTTDDMENIYNDYNPEN